jgi:hypothetical protein
MATQQRPAVVDEEHEYNSLTMALKIEDLIKCSDMKLSHRTSLFPRTWSPAHLRALPYSFALVLLCATRTDFAVGAFGDVPN